MTEKKVLKLATRPSRFLAYLLDSLIGAFIPGLLGILFGDTLAGVGVLAFLIAQIYFYTRGQSIGKAILGLRIVREEDGRPIGFGYMLLRELILKPVINAFFYIGSLWILIDDRNCGLYDKILNTIVIDERGEDEDIEGHYRTITEGNVTVAPTDDPIKNKVSYTMTAEEARAAYENEKAEKVNPESAEKVHAENSATPNASDAKPASEPEAAATVQPKPETNVESEIKTASSYLDEMKK